MPLLQNTLPSYAGRLTAKAWLHFSFFFPFYPSRPIFWDLCSRIWTDNPSSVHHVNYSLLSLSVSPYTARIHMAAWQREESVSFTATWPAAEIVCECVCARVCVCGLPAEMCQLVFLDFPFSPDCSTDCETLTYSRHISIPPFRSVVKQGIKTLSKGVSSLQWNIKSRKWIFWLVTDYFVHFVLWMTCHEKGKMSSLCLFLSGFGYRCADLLD